MGHEGVYAMTPIAALGHHTTGSQSIDGSHLGGSMGRGSSLSRTSLGQFIPIPLEAVLSLSIQVTEGV